MVEKGFRLTQLNLFSKPHFQKKKKKNLSNLFTNITLKMWVLLNNTPFPHRRVVSWAEIIVWITWLHRTLSSEHLHFCSSSWLYKENLRKRKINFRSSEKHVLITRIMFIYLQFYTCVLYELKITERLLHRSLVKLSHYTYTDQMCVFSPQQHGLLLLYIMFEKISSSVLGLEWSSTWGKRRRSSKRESAFLWDLFSLLREVICHSLWNWNATVNPGEKD